jgi:serine/threonine-protein kinase RsbW
MISAPMIFDNVSLTDLSQIRQQVEKYAVEMGARQDVIDDIVIAVNEAVANIVRHGYCKQPGHIEIAFEQNGGSLIIKILDEAPLFNPTIVAQPDMTLPLAQRPFGGMGVYMMRNLADELSYQVTPEGKNELTLRKNNAFKRIS